MTVITSCKRMERICPNCENFAGYGCGLDTQREAPCEAWTPSSHDNYRNTPWPCQAGPDDEWLWGFADCVGCPHGN